MDVRNTYVERSGLNELVEGEEKGMELLLTLDYFCGTGEKGIPLNIISKFAPERATDYQTSKKDSPARIRINGTVNTSKRLAHVVKYYS